MMITDKHSQTLIFWCQNSSIEQSDLSSLNSLNKNEHYKSASKTKQQYGHQNPTKKHSENFANVKSPF